MWRVAVLVGLAVSASACNALLGIDDVASKTHDAPPVDAIANTIDSAVIDAHVVDAPPGTPDAKIDASAPDAGVPDAGPLTLTVKNYLSWCSVSVAGATGSTAASQMIDVTQGQVVTLREAPASSSFILGLWHHTDGDTTGSGEPGTLAGGQSMTTATISTASACVWVCCPFTNGSGCPSTDQCP
jgi:hypothetical protein